MDNRAAKLANARKKLRDHQEKKSIYAQKEDTSDTLSSCGTPSDKICIGSEAHKEDLYVINCNKNDEKPENEETRVEQNSHCSNNIDISVLGHEKSFANVTEILIFNKTDLEMQNKNLQSKILHLEQILANEVTEHNYNKQKLCALECELNNADRKQSMLNESLCAQDTLLNDLKNQVKVLSDDNNNLIEQQEFTKAMLTAKEREVSQLHNQVSILQNQVEATTLQLQQLTSDTNIKINNTPEVNEESELLKEKIAYLEHELDTTLKEKDQINSHYEHYMSKLNEQIKTQTTKNEALSLEVKNLSNRESALIEQIGLLEIRMQNYRRQSEEYAVSHNNTLILELKDNAASLQAELDGLRNKYNELQKQYDESVKKIEQLNEAKEQEVAQENISVTKLNADITSDKIAAQRATEQNKKLKTDVEELEQIVIKLGKDKLELTEKLSHEKQLNKQLMLKLAEIDEMSKQMQTKLTAKDEEMMRLQASYRDLENKHESLLENLLQSKENAVAATNQCNTEVIEEPKSNGTEDEENCLISDINECSNNCTMGNVHEELKQNNKIVKEDAMYKLQQRFLNIMDQVANLSDEKHRLEHIILQLQTETDTICEYVALYQQQRSLLKKRDEERSAQIKLFQVECDEVKRQLEDLSALFLKLAQDSDLSPHLQGESKHNDISKIKNLLENLLNSSLINSTCKSLEMKNFYPCSCCSGQLIVV